MSSELRIIYHDPNENNILKIVAPTENYLDDHTMDDLVKAVVPVGVEYKILPFSELPSSRVFRNVWKLDSRESKVEPDITEAKQLAHEFRRKKREQEFAPLDAVISKQIPGSNLVKLEQDRQNVRNKYADIQTVIDSTDDISELTTLADSLADRPWNK